MSNTQTESTILQVPIEDIIPNRFQPRLAFDDDSLKDLSSSIKQHGIIQPLVLRRKNDKYEIIAGERRYKAAKLAGLVSVPAIISNMDDNTSAEVAIVENIQRKDLTAIEEAKSYQQLLDKGYMTQEDLARKMGLSQSAISNKLRLLTLDESVQDAILQEKISERHARTLLKISNHQRQKELLDKVLKERLTVRQLEEIVKNEVQSESLPAPEKENVEVKQNITEEVKETIEPPKSEPAPLTGDLLFSNPEKMPNKFFNFLEDTAANMDFEEPTPVSAGNGFEEVAPVPDTLFTQPEEIEMLDDLGIIPVENNYYEEVLGKIKSLNLDPNKVEIKEADLLNEYQVIVTIKKEKNN